MMLSKHAILLGPFLERLAAHERVMMPQELLNLFPPVFELLLHLITSEHETIVKDLRL